MTPRTKLFFDFEFTGLHQNTTPISLGIISESGCAFYAIFTDYDDSRLSSDYPDGEWLRNNILPHLDIPEDIVPANYRYVEGNRQTVVSVLTAWLENNFPNGVEMWGDVLAYDWVLFCELFGGALYLPKSIYYIPFDIATYLKVCGLDPDLPRRVLTEPETKLCTGMAQLPHNALADAYFVLNTWTCLKTHYLRANYIIPDTD